MAIVGHQPVLAVVGHQPVIADVGHQPVVAVTVDYWIRLTRPCSMHVTPLDVSVFDARDAA